MRRLFKTSLSVKPETEEIVRYPAKTRDEAVARLKYDWIDSRKSKLLQLKNVWKMWNQVGTAKPRSIDGSIELTFRLCW